MKVWATTDRQASVMLLLWMSNTNCGFLITFTQKRRGRLRAGGRTVRRASAALGSPRAGGEKRLTCGLTILPALAFTVTMDFHAAGETRPESRAVSEGCSCWPAPPPRSQGRVCTPTGSLALGHPLCPAAVLQA